jgi:iron complex transport system ATP-binding protein
MVRGEKSVLRNIHWTTRLDEHWFIMGNNGSGKTTLLEIVLGYLWPQTGDVTVLGERFGNAYLPDLRKRVGYIAPWVLKRIRPGIPVNDVIASGEDASIGFVESLSKDLKHRVGREAKFFGCGAFLHSAFGNLSSGQQIRAILARAMVHKSDILVFDEPFAHLDMKARAQMHDLIGRIASRRGGPQIILVTHHLEDICPVFTHGLLLKDGRVANQGPKEDLLKRSVIAKALGVPIKYLRGIRR